MEEKKQFLCGVVEGKSARLPDRPVRSCDFFFLGGLLLNRPPFDLYPQPNIFPYLLETCVRGVCVKTGLGGMKRVFKKI